MKATCLHGCGYVDQLTYEGVPDPVGGPGALPNESAAAQKVIAGDGCGVTLVALDRGTRRIPRRVLPLMHAGASGMAVAAQRWPGRKNV